MYIHTYVFMCVCERERESVCVFVCMLCRRNARLAHTDNMCPHTALCVLILFCVLMPLYICTHKYYKCVLILL